MTGLWSLTIGCVGARVPSDEGETEGGYESPSMGSGQGKGTEAGSTEVGLSAGSSSNDEAGTTAGGHGSSTTHGEEGGVATSTSGGGMTSGGHESGIVCRPNAYRCEGAQLLLCDASGQTEQLVETCLTAPACFAEAGGCRICEPGTFECESATEVWACDPSGTRLEQVEACPQGQYCNDGEKLCNPWVCPPFSFFCEGPALNQCFHDGSGFIDAGLWCHTGRCDAETQSCVHDDDGTSETG